MTFVRATPDLLRGHAEDWARVGSSLSDANAAAAAPTAEIVPPGADRVSVLITGLLGDHAQKYQQLSSQLAQFHDQMVQTLQSSAAAYADADAANNSLF